MSSGYVNGPSRSAWEGATFYQRMNPASMTHVPEIRHHAGDDALAAYVESMERPEPEPAHEPCTCQCLEAKAWRNLKGREAAKMRRWRNKRRNDDATPF